MGEMRWGLLDISIRQRRLGLWRELIAAWLCGTKLEVLKRARPGDRICTQAHKSFNSIKKQSMRNLSASLGGKTKCNSHYSAFLRSRRDSSARNGADQRQPCALFGPRLTHEASLQICWHLYKRETRLADTEGGVESGDVQ